MNQDNNDEISMKELINKIRVFSNYLFSKWYLILLAGCIGAAAGFIYAWLQPIKYESRLTFVVEENKTGMGGLAAIAGQFGFDLSGSSNDGVFAGDNVLLFLKSESLCREVLLTDYDSSKKLLVDKYIEVNNLKNKWIKNKKIGREISFVKYKNGNLPRLEDSLMQLITKRILKKELSVTKPDKKASFIEVSTTTRDELFSKYFTERLVKTATDQYINSKIKVKAFNVAKLQRRADSLGGLLNYKTYAAASAQQVLVDVNPALRSAPVAAEITSRDKTMIATIFAEVVKNLEIAKVALSQETPVIEVVDKSSLPLKVEKTNKLLFLLLGFTFMSIFYAGCLIVKKVIKDIM